MCNIDRFLFSDTSKHMLNIYRSAQKAYRAAEGHLEDTSIASSAECKVLAGVKGHRHDADIEKH